MSSSPSPEQQPEHSPEQDPQPSGEPPQDQVDAVARDSRDGTAVWRDVVPEIEAGDLLPDSAGTVVVGAGLTGVTTALELRRRGHEVLLLEATTVGAGTTGRTTGKASLLQGTRYGDIRRFSGDDAVRSYAEAGAAARDWIQAELAEVPDALRPQPAFTYATSQPGIRSLQAEADAMRVAGVTFETRFGEVGLPFLVSRALVMTEQGQLQPLVALAVLAAKARAAGVRIVDRCRVTAADAGAHGVTLNTTRGAVRAQRVIIATGFPAIDRGGFFATLTPTREIVAAYTIEGPVPQGMYLSADPVTRSLRPAVDEHGRELLVVGGPSFFPGRVPDTRRILRAQDRWTAQAFPSAKRVRWWAAQDYRLTNRMPYVGAMPMSHDRIFVATGFAKWGMTTAVAAALALCGQLEGDAPAWAQSLARRHKSLRGAAQLARTVGEVAAHTARGWAGPGETHTERGVRAGIRRDGAKPIAHSEIDGVTCEVSAVCTHMSGVVRWNTLERTWDCPLHGSRFAPDGRVIEGPAQRDLPSAAGRQERPREPVGGDSVSS